MYGAILGDIIGSPFEFDRGRKTKEFELFTRGCGFTDDSVMTVAIAEALIAIGPDANEMEIEEAVIANMQDWGRSYPHAGYGGKFRQWLGARNPKPYGSYGNGSAMRVSAAGWLYPTIERTREVAEATAAVTHNHPEGIKGAVATASCIFLARNGATKEEIKRYVEQEFHYDLSRSLDEIRPYYHHVENCQQTVPEAITAFLEADNFEDAIRNAVSLGGDTDTLAAIAGSIAEAYFGIPAILKAERRNRVDPEMNRVLDAFDEVLGRSYSLKEGDTVTLDHEVRIRMDTVAAGDGEEWFYIFTNEEEIHKQPVPNVIMEIPFADIFDTAARSDRVAGVVINPFGRYFKADKSVIECIYEVFEKMED